MYKSEAFQCKQAVSRYWHVACPVQHSGPHSLSDAPPSASRQGATATKQEYVSLTLTDHVADLYIHVQQERRRSSVILHVPACIQAE